MTLTNPAMQGKTAKRLLIYCQPLVFLYFQFPSPTHIPTKNNKIHLHKLTNRLPHSTFPEAKPYVSHAENVQLGLEKRRFRTRET